MTGQISVIIDRLESGRARGVESSRITRWRTADSAAASHALHRLSNVARACKKGTT